MTVWILWGKFLMLNKKSLNNCKKIVNILFYRVLKNGIIKTSFIFYISMREVMMFTKKVIATLIAFLISMFFVTNVSAGRDWTEVISDPQDSRSSADIRRIYVCDDGTNWSFKIESWKDWKLLAADRAFLMYFNTSGTSSLDDADYNLVILGEDTSYIGMFFERNSDNSVLIPCDMTQSDPIGTFSISKKILKTPKRKFSILAYVILLDKEGYYSDAAPDDQTMKLYKSSEKPPETKLIVNSTSLDFGEVRWRENVSLPLLFENQGENTIHLNISTSSNIRLSKTSINLEEYEESSVDVIVNASNLEAGGYHEFIELKSDYGNESVQVYFEILPKPILEVDVNEIDFGDCYRGETKKNKLHIYNTLKGPIQGKIYTEGNWFRVSELEFDDHGKYIDVYLTTKKTEFGLLTGEIRINSEGGNIQIPVEANLLPSFIADPIGIEYGEVDLDNFENEPQTYSILNNTDRTLDVKIGNTESWIQCANTTITIKKGESKELRIALILSEMKEVNKVYEGVIILESEYDTIELPVSVHITQTPPKLEWLESDDKKPSFKTSIYKGQSFEHSFQIRNCGSGELEVDFSIDKSEANFRLFTRPCTLKAGECEDIIIKLDSRTLDIGTYKTTLSIASNGGNLEVPITVEVMEIPVVVITLTIGSATATINDEVIMLEEAPYIQKGTTMVPLRFVGEAFNAEIEWENIGKGRIIMKAGENTIQLDIGKTVALINGQPKLLPVAPEIKSGRTFVPLRFIGESFGATIDWDGEVQMITITYTMPIPTE